MASVGATRRIAVGVLADLLGQLKVPQDQSTAEGLLDAAVDVELRRRSGVGEVIVITLPLDPPDTGTTAATT
jgi:hypothetical protein